MNKNHELRLNSKNVNENRLFKLLYNSLSGPSMLNKEKYSSSVNNKNKCEKVISKHNFNDFDIVDEELIPASNNKSTIILDSPNYIGVRFF